MINVETQDMDLFFFIDTGDLDPEMTSISRSFAAFNASSIPETVSWSVRAMAVSPRPAARFTTSVGVKEPSEAVVNVKVDEFHISEVPFLICNCDAVYQ